MKGKTFHLNVEESTCGSGLWLCLPLLPPGGSVSTLQKQNWAARSCSWTWGGPGELGAGMRRAGILLCRHRRRAGWGAQGPPGGCGGRQAALSLWEPGPWPRCSLPRTPATILPLFLGDLAGEPSVTFLYLTWRVLLSLFCRSPALWSGCCRWTCLPFYLVNKVTSVCLGENASLRAVFNRQ